MDIAEMEQIAKSAKLGADEIPDEFVGLIEDIRSEKDSYDRTCVTIDVQIKDTEEHASIKYTPMHLKTLTPALKKLGFADQESLIGKQLRFKKQKFRIGYDRPVPVALE